MIETIVYLTGVAVWFAVISAIALIVMWMLATAFVSAWHVVRVWRHGWLVPKSKHPAWSILTPFKTWLYFWLKSPRYVERHDDKGGRIYRPFAKRLPERYPG